MALLPQFVFADELVFIVNAGNPLTQISSADLRDYFLKRKRVWPDKTDVRFIDRPSSVPLRKLFLEKIINKSAKDLELYWIGQKLYSGDSAPLQEAQESMIVKFVSTFKGAIGYISSSTEIDSKLVKIVKID